MVDLKSAILCLFRIIRVNTVDVLLTPTACWQMLITQITPTIDRLVRPYFVPYTLGRLHQEIRVDWRTIITV